MRKKQYRIVQTTPLGDFVVQVRLFWLWWSLFDTDYGPKTFRTEADADEQLRNYWRAQAEAPFYPRVVKVYS